MYQGLYRLEGSTEDVESVIEWFGVHPGNELDVLLKNYTLGLYHNSELSNEILVIPDYYIFLLWDRNMLHGYISALSRESLIDNFPLWVNQVWAMRSKLGVPWEDMVSLIKQTSPPEDISQETLPEPLTASFPSPNSLTQEVPFSDIRSFSQVLWNVITLRPWNYIFLQSILLTPDGLKMVFQYHEETSTQFPFDVVKSLEDKILGGDEKVLTLLFNATYVSIRYFFDERFTKFSQYARLLEKYFNSETPLDTLPLFISDLRPLMEINREFFIESISNFLQTIAGRDSFDDNLVGQLLSLSDTLYSEEFFDLAKLCEGTAFEMALTVSDSDLKREFLTKLMRNNLQWGEEAVIGLLNVLSSFLEGGVVEQETFNSLLDLAIPLLERTNRGLSALIELLVTVGRIDEAVQYRFKMTEEIVNDEQMAIEIFKAILWMIDKERINETVLSKILQTYLPRALEKAAPGETFLRQISYIYEDINKRELDGLLVKVTTVIIKNMKKIALLDRFDTLRIINDSLSSKEKFRDLIVEINTRMFSVALEEGLVDEAEKLYHSIIQMLDRDSPFFYDNFFRFCKRTVIASAKYGYEAYLNKIVQMMKEELSTPELREKYKVRIFELLAEAIKETERIPPSDSLHPGVRLYRLAFSLSHEFETPDLIVNFTEEAPKFAYRKKDYESYAQFSIFHIRSLYANKRNWLRAFFVAVNSLVGVSKFELVRFLFAEVNELEITLDERRQVLEKILEIAELHSESFLTPEEVIDLRNEFIEIVKEKSEDPITALEQYQKGIDELLENNLKSDAIDLLLEAIGYCISSELPSTSFVSSLMELFKQQLSETNGNLSRMREIVYKVVRGINNIADGAPLTVLPFVTTGITSLVHYPDKIGARIIALESFLLLSKRMEETQYEGTKEIHSLIESIANLYKPSRNDLNSHVLYFKVKYELYHAARQSKKVVSALSSILNTLKRPSFAAKKPTSSIISSVFLISQVYANAVGKFQDDVMSELQREIVNYFSSLEHILTDGSSFSALMLEIISNLQENTQGTLLNLIFQIKPLVETFDSSYL